MKIFTPTVILILSVSFYFVGGFFIPPTNIEPLEITGVASQEEYTYTDRDGEEHEGQALIEIDGVGKILTYEDVYFSVIALLMPFAALGKIIWNDENLTGVIHGNCIVGMFLIWLTTKGYIIPTILFWAGILLAGYANSTKRTK